MAEVLAPSAEPVPAPAPAGEPVDPVNLGYAVAVEAFSGPMDLLLHLVRKAEVNILDIPLAEIADQFVATVRSWQERGELDLEAAGDFIYLAANLLEIKARTIAPPPEEEQAEDAEDEDLDPRTDLIGKLLAYRRFSEVSGLLRQAEEVRAKRCLRQFRETVPDDPAEAEGLDLGELHAGLLFNEWEAVLKRIGATGPRTVLKDDIPLEDTIDRLVATAKAATLAGDTAGLQAELQREPTLLGRVTLLMGTLEGTRKRYFESRQLEQYGDVRLRWRDDEERARPPGELPPEVPWRKRQRKPPLVTYTPKVPKTEPTEEEQDAATEAEARDERLESDEERFLRELNEACDLDGVLARTADVEGGFKRHWEILHPPPPPPPVPESVVPVIPPGPTVTELPVAPIAIVAATDKSPADPETLPIPAGQGGPGEIIVPVVVAEPVAVLVTPGESLVPVVEPRAEVSPTPVAVPTVPDQIEAALVAVQPPSVSVVPESPVFSWVLADWPVHPPVEALILPPAPWPGIPLVAWPGLPEVAVVTVPRPIALAAWPGLPEVAELSLGAPATLPASEVPSNESAISDVAEIPRAGQAAGAPGETSGETPGDPSASEEAELSLGAPVALPASEVPSNESAMSDVAEIPRAGQAAGAPGETSGETSGDPSASEEAVEPPGAPAAWPASELPSNESAMSDVAEIPRAGQAAGAPGETSRETPGETPGEPSASVVAVEPPGAPAAWPASEVPSNESAMSDVEEISRAGQEAGAPGDAPEDPGTPAESSPSPGAPAAWPASKVPSDVSAPSEDTMHPRVGRAVASGVGDSSRERQEARNTAQAPTTPPISGQRLPLWLVPSMFLGGAALVSWMLLRPPLPGPTPSSQVSVTAAPTMAAPSAMELDLASRDWLAVPAAPPEPAASIQAANPAQSGESSSGGSRQVGTPAIPDPGEPPSAMARDLATRDWFAIPARTAQPIQDLEITTGPLFDLLARPPARWLEPGESAALPAWHVLPEPPETPGIGDLAFAAPVPVDLAWLARPGAWTWLLQPRPPALAAWAASVSLDGVPVTVFARPTGWYRLAGAGNIP